MMKYEALVKEALYENGIATDGYRIVTEVEKGGVNFCKFIITVYEPRCRKPSTIWEAPYDLCRNHLLWNQATLVYNKAW